MTGWIALPLRAHRLGLAGKVIDAETRRPVAGVAVEMTAMPEALRRAVDARARAGRTATADDGCFCFADLPDGAYTLSFSAPGGARFYGRARRDFTVGGDAAIAEIALPPTGVRGRIQGLVQGAPAALPLARVRVEGGGERAYGGPDGRFRLTGAEPGARRLHVDASGFRRAIVEVAVDEGTISDVGTVVLEPATS